MRKINLNQSECKIIEFCILQEIESEEYSIPDFKDVEHMRFLFWRSSILNKVRSGTSELRVIKDANNVIETLLNNSIDATHFEMQQEMPDFSDMELMEFWMNRAELLEKLQSAN